jgi:hypothetical protein
MADTTTGQAEQTSTTEASGTEIPTPAEQSDFEELREASQHFFNTLVRVGMHLARTPVSQLPEESREHFTNASSEFTRGLSTLAHELASTVEKVAEEVSMHEKKDASKDVR